MLQLFQYQKTGEIFVEDLPIPMLKDNGVLVKTHFSLKKNEISSFLLILYEGGYLRKALKGGTLIQQGETFCLLNGS